MINFKALIISLLNIFLFACSESTIEFENLVKRQGLYYEVNSQRPYTGTFASYHSNGQLNFLGALQAGLASGAYSAFHINGETKIESEYIDGKLHGPYREYFENGQVKLLSTYRMGDLSGGFEEYFENGTLRVKTTYESGEYNGIYEEYFDSGQIKVRGEFASGEHTGLLKKHFEDGQLKSQETFSAGSRDGDSKYYSSDGRLIREEKHENGALGTQVRHLYFRGGVYGGYKTFKENEVHGPFRLYYDDGKIRTQGSVGKCGSEASLDLFNREGVLESKHVDLCDGSGLSEEYYSNGKVKQREEFIPTDNCMYSIIGAWLFGSDERHYGRLSQGNACAPHGASEEFFPNGRLKSRVVYEGGILNGPSETYYENGELRTKGFFRDWQYHQIEFNKRIEQ